MENKTASFEVSVIVPVFNDAVRLRNLLECLSQSTWDKERFEILLVDNGSTDESLAVAQECAAKEGDRVRVLTEHTIAGSYAARNRGLEECRGAIIAFTDSDCSPVPEWLEEGSTPIRAGKADLVGGQVVFTFQNPVSGAELFDSITHMQIAHDVAERGVAKTANLFVKRSCFDEIGSFPAEVQSGGDVRWTARATQAGYRLVYAESAIIRHRARVLSELVIKQQRTGYGYIAVKREEGRSWPWILKMWWKHVWPPARFRVANYVDRNPALLDPENFKKALRACWAGRRAFAYGQACYVIDRLLKRRNQRFR